MTCTHGIITAVTVKIRDLDPSETPRMAAKEKVSRHHSLGLVTASKL